MRDVHAYDHEREERDVYVYDHEREEFRPRWPGAEFDDRTARLTKLLREYNKYYKLPGRYGSEEWLINFEKPRKRANFTVEKIDLSELECVISTEQYRPGRVRSSWVDIYRTPDGRYIAHWCSQWQGRLNVCVYTDEIFVRWILEEY